MTFFVSKSGLLPSLLTEPVSYSMIDSLEFNKEDLEEAVANLPLRELWYQNSIWKILMVLGIRSSSKEFIFRVNINFHGKIKRNIFLEPWILAKLSYMKQALLSIDWYAFFNWNIIWELKSYQL